VILRKPYAFLIKHFRLIHLILALPLIYIIRKTHLVVDFFNTYVSNGYTYQTGSDVSGIYINWLLYLSIFIIIISILSIYFLLKYKEKPVKMYIVMMIYYLVLFMMLIWYAGIISNMSRDILSAKSARFYRDISLLIYLPQYIFIIFTALRAVGFNIKKFNFQSDLKEMQITSEDSEEVEVGLEIDPYKTKRFFRRYKREFTYYVIENKLMITIVLTVTIFSLLFIFYKTRNNYDITYSQNKAFSHQAFTVNVKDSIISNMGYDGNKIDDKYYYLVLKTYVRNNAAQTIKLDYDNFEVISGKKRYKPVLDRSTYFLDYANPYYGDYLKTGEEKEIALVYRLEKSEINKSFKLRLLSSYNSEKEKLVTKYAIVNLTPVILDSIINIQTVNTGSKLILNNTNIGNTIFMVNNFEITKSYTYQREQCASEGNCRTVTEIANIDYTKGSKTNTLLVLDYDFDLDKETTYGKTTKNDFKFFDDFVSVKTTVYDEEKNYSAINVTPNNLQNKLILQVNGDIMDKEDVDIYITVRNKRYIINLK